MPNNHQQLLSAANTILKRDMSKLQSYKFTSNVSQENKQDNTKVVDLEQELKK